MRRKKFISTSVLLATGAFLNSMCAKVKINSATGKNVKQNDPGKPGNVSVNPIIPSNALLIVIQGESNAVGYAANASATGGELGARANVKILNTSTLLFETLNISSNNYAKDSSSHGMELDLANKVDAGYFTGYTEVYLVKTGVNGTKISDWEITDSAYINMKARVDAARSILTGMGKTIKQFWWYSQGINDIGTTVTQDWIDGTVAHFVNIRALYGSTMKIFMTKFPPNLTRFNTNMDDIAAADANTFALDYTGVTLNVDGIHWDYAGTKAVADKMAVKTLLYL